MTSSDELKSLLKLKSEGNFILSTREGSKIEYKETFNFSNLAIYAKTMAGQSNNSGGFIVFGVKDSPRELIGLTNNRFDEIDPVKITRFLNANFNPEINYEINTLEVYEKRIGYIYTSEAQKKPIICTSNNGSELHESRIYYRYRGLTTDIKYPELRKIFDDAIENERNSWLKSLERIARVGPENIMLLDTINNEMLGGKNKTYIIDESLITKINFIKAGSFNESSGEPTLKLIGDVVPADNISVSRNVPVGIDYDSLIITFLSQKSLSKEEAKAFLKESFNQTSVYVPMFYFMKMAEIASDEITSLISETRHLTKRHIEDIEKRIEKIQSTSEEIISSEFVFEEIPESISDIKNYFELIPTIGLKRKSIIGIFKKHPGYMKSNLDEYEKNIIMNAICEMSTTDVNTVKEELLAILLEIYMDEYHDFPSLSKTYFRKAVAHIDDSMFGISI